jgi:hypothetical protein
MPLPNFLKPLHEPVVLPLAQNFPSIHFLPLRGWNTYLRESKLSPTVTVLLDNIQFFSLARSDPLVTHLLYDGISGF